MTRIDWSAEALDCIERIHEYIAIRNPVNAARVVSRIVGAVSLLSHSPSMGRAVPRYERFELRELIRRPYRIVYVKRDSRIVVLAIGDSRRDLPRLLKDW